MMSPLLVVSCHSPDGVRFDGRDFGLLVDFGAAAARALAQRHGEVGRRDVAVVGVIQRADDLRACRLPSPRSTSGQRSLDLVGADDLEGHADGVGGAAVLLILVHALAAGGEAQVAGDVEADVLAGLGRQALVQVDRIFVQLPDRVAHVEQRQQSRRVPGGAGGQFRALQQHHVRPAFHGQVVQRADADHAAADDDDAGMSFHVSSPNANAPGSVTSRV